MKPHILQPTILLTSIATLALTACSAEAEKPTNPPVKTQTQAVKTTPAPTVETVQLSPEILGKKLYTRCRACHTLEAGGRHRVGPNLHNIFGRTAGTAEGYAYSKAMKASGIVWNAETISGYLERPSAYLPKNKMAFAGLRKQSDRDNIIAYLKTATAE